MALCLSLCPTWALAADAGLDAGLCPHHRVHTEDCGYVPLTPGRDCAHGHDESCFLTETFCVHQHTEDCYPETGLEQDADAGPVEPEPSLCVHACSEDSGCVARTLSCPHAHDELCGYAPEDVGVPCGFACRLCPIENLIGQLPVSVTPDNRSQVEDQLDALLTLYTELTGDEQDQLDLAHCYDLLAQLDAANAQAMLGANSLSYTPDRTYFIYNDFSAKQTYVVTEVVCFHTFREGKYTYTMPGGAAIRVEGTGTLYLADGRVISENGAGVEVLAGGSMYTDATDLTVTGTTYGLDIASGTTVKLTSGAFTGGTAAIRTADNDFNKLLEDGYAYFDLAGEPITDVASAKSVVVRAQPKVEWSDANDRTVDYTGKPVDKSVLPVVSITYAEDLSGYLRYSYAKVNDDGSESAYVDGLPTNAGKYHIKANIPATEDYAAASSGPVTLIINKIDPIVNVPVAVSLTYNGTYQQLVTPGAARDGAVIQFKLGQNGVYSPNIPTGMNAPDAYRVWYKVEETENYKEVPDTEVTGVDIQPKQIVPTVEVSPKSYPYDGTKKEPVITVKDGDTMLPGDQYTVTWTYNKGNFTEIRDAGTYTATVASTNNNYTFTGKTVTVEVVEAAQEALKITNKPDVVCYGDTITLDTVGGSANGSVTWTLTGGTSPVTNATGIFDITSMGNFTVTAERLVENYGTVKDSWSFTVQPKPVTAEVTVTAKVYDGGLSVPAANISAKVKDSDLVNGDGPINITGLTGAYDNANVGTSKTVTLNSSNPSVSGAGQIKYKISYPAAVTGTITPKNITSLTVTLSDHDLKTDANGKQYYIYDGNAKTPAVTVRGDGADIPSSNYDVYYSGNKNVGTANVTVTAKGGGNYTFSSDGTAAFEIRNAGAVLLSSPKANDLTYNKNAQDLVSVGAVTNGYLVYSLDENGTYERKIPQGINAGTYTVYYKVKGNENYDGIETPSHVSVTIKPKEITPIITLAPSAYTYSGSECKPTVTVKDGSDTITKTNGVDEFTVSYRNNVNAGTATVVVSNANGGNYIVNGTVDFTIQKAEQKNVTPPVSKGSLPYNGSAQELITRGGSPDGTMVYSLDGLNYSEAVPTGAERGRYTVYYKVLGDANHNDYVGNAPLTVEITTNTVTNPRIILSPNTFRYNGNQQTPTITVYDDHLDLIQETEYTVAYRGKKPQNTNPVDVDTYTVTITQSADSNYIIQSNNTAVFEITETDQETISITGMRDQVYYGSVFQLGTSGGTGNGQITWKSSNSAVADVDSNGLVTANKVGTVTITVEKAGDNYSTSTASYTFTVKPKSTVVTVDLTLPAGGLVYDGTTKVPDGVTVTAGDGTVLAVGTDYTVSYSNNTNAGTATLTATSVAGSNYTFEPKRENFVIAKQQIKFEQKPQGETGLTYTGSPQTLMRAGSTVDGVGVVKYKVGEDGTYSPGIPEATDAGTYKVWYKVEDVSGNYAGISEPERPVLVTIGRKPVTVTGGNITLSDTGLWQDSSGNYYYEPSATPGTPGVKLKENDGTVIPAGEYTASCIVTENTTGDTTTTTYNIAVTITDTGTDTGNGNYNISGGTYAFTAGIQAKPPASDSGSTGSSGGSGANSVPTISTPSASNTAASPMQTSVQNGSAKTVVSAAATSALVKEAAADQSKNVVIKPEITGDVSKTEVSIPASTMRQLKSATSADLTVSTPVADVTIPNTALSTLSSAGGNVSVMAEQKVNSVAVTLTAGGKEVKSVPGGLTVTVPVENATPGTVAVLVHEDGARETIRKSIAGDGKLNIPLDGSATVEIVDNSKGFSDVSPTDWLADAVAFVSAREMFNGTDEPTFSPEQSMSRAMAATVLYNLEGHPEQSGVGGFSDISGDSWYADSVAWATENGITTGYSEDQCGPNDSVTREQFAVMLWRYAGSPTTGNQTLNFTDADQANDYALEALSWAAANGILNGYGDGRLDPGGLATRAEAAQMLKNFMENT